MVAKKKAEGSENKIDRKVEKDIVEVPVGKYFDKVRSNPWIASTVVLVVVLVLVLAFGGSSGVSGNVVSADEAGAKVLDFLNSNPSITGEVELVSSELDGQFYKVILNYQDQEVPVFTTLDGEFLVGNPVALNEVEDTAGDTATPAETQPSPDTSVPKSDKPVVELFIMSHCPYGTQIEKGIMPVVKTLGDKIDFELKFVNYAMHGEKEVLEQLNQYCIESEQNDKLLTYLECFLEASDGQGCLVEAGVDQTKLATCAARVDQEFAIKDNLADQSKWLNGRFPQFNTHKAENEEYGVKGSPTLVVNGQQASSGRDPASLLGTICAAFNDAPEECNTELSAASPSPGFGWSATAGDSAAAAQCG
ncbi:MAG: DsbA family protein [archaeon]